MTIGALADAIPQSSLNDQILFNRPYLTGNEQVYIQQSFMQRKLCGDGSFSRKCERFFEERFGFKKALLTTSCTDALEMTGLLMNLQPGDEVIVPSFTFVSTANAYVLRGARIVFADSEANTPNIDVSRLEELITPKTKAIVIVHYAGIACDMDALQALTEKHGLYLVEDAAHAIDAYYKGKPLGSFGHMSTFSFHETKNIVCGEGGLLAINDERLVERAEVIREKGTNRQAFFRGQVDKYTWQDVGSSFLPADYVAAFLWAQLEQLDDIQAQRLSIWNQYNTLLNPLEVKGLAELPKIPADATHNAHMFYLIMQNLEQRQFVLNALKQKGISATFHYQPLQESPFYKPHHDGRALPHSAHYADCLMRLPLYAGLTDEQVKRIAQAVIEACEAYNSTK
jgi:dTDP-4-amino-4,6-dideoxygalactose transaminase